MFLSDVLMILAQTCLVFGLEKCRTKLEIVVFEKKTFASVKIKMSSEQSLAKSFIMNAFPDLP
jgi:hypothetical protein